MCIMYGKEIVMSEYLYSTVIVDVKQGIITIRRNKSSYGIANYTKQLLMRVM